MGAANNNYQALREKQIAISGKITALEETNSIQFLNLDGKLDRLLDYQKTQNGNVARIQEEFKQQVIRRDKEIRITNDKVQKLEVEFAPIRKVMKRPALWLMILAVLVVGISYTIKRFNIDQPATYTPTVQTFDSTIVKNK